MSPSSITGKTAPFVACDCKSTTTPCAMECGSCPACKVAGLGIHKNYHRADCCRTDYDKVVIHPRQMRIRKKKIETITHCPRGCNTVLRKEIESKISDVECGACLQDMRPFNHGRSGPCYYCIKSMQEVEILHIICDTCNEQKCARCNKVLEYHYDLLSVYDNVYDPNFLCGFCRHHR